MYTNSEATNKPLVIEQFCPGIFSQHIKRIADLYFFLGRSSSSYAQDLFPELSQEKGNKNGHLANEFSYEMAVTLVLTGMSASIAQ